MEFFAVKMTLRCVVSDTPNLQPNRVDPDPRCVRRVDHVADIEGDPRWPLWGSGLHGLFAFEYLIADELIRFVAGNPLGPLLPWVVSVRPILFGESPGERGGPCLGRHGTQFFGVEIKRIRNFNG